MADLNQFRRIVRGSKRYEFDDRDNLVITDWYTGESVTLDLLSMDQETLDNLIVEDEED